MLISAPTPCSSRVFQYMAHVMLAVVFGKKLRHDILSNGLKENAVIRALHIYQEDGEPKSMLATHVDDMLWATKSGYEDRVQQLLVRYTTKTVESGTFRFCGREVIQHSEFSVSVKCKDTTEKIEPVRYDPKGRKQTDLARDHEIVQLRSVVGSLAWVARQCKPQLSYGVNKLQSVCGTATLDDLRFANKLYRTTDSPSKTDFHLEQDGDAHHYRYQLRKRVEFPQSKRADDFSHWT